MEKRTKLKYLGNFPVDMNTPMLLSDMSPHPPPEVEANGHGTGLTNYGVMKKTENSEISRCTTMPVDRITTAYNSLA